MGDLTLPQCVWGATAKRVEGTEIGIGCSGGVSQEVDQELSKTDGARASGGQKSPSWAQGQSQ